MANANGSIRRDQVTPGATAVARAFDQRSDSLVTVTGQPAARYVVGGVQAFSRDVAGNDADPNVTPPGAAAYVDAERHGEVCWYMVLGVGQSCNVEVWTEEETTPGVTEWLHQATVTGVVSRTEYRHTTRYRPVLLRVTGSAGIAPGSTAPQRAAGI